MKQELQTLQNPEDIKSQKVAFVNLPPFNINLYSGGASVIIRKSIYKELPMGFAGQNELKGYEFIQLTSSPDAYMFLVMHEREKWYEVFMKKINFNLLKNEYPTSEAFGQSAWRFKSKNDAFDQFFKISGID